MLLVQAVALLVALDTTHQVAVLWLLPPHQYILRQPRLTSGTRSPLLAGLISPFSSPARSSGSQPTSTLPFLFFRCHSSHASHSLPTPARRTLIILWWNANGICFKKMKLMEFIKRCSIYVALVKESKLRETSKTPGYSYHSASGQSWSASLSPLPTPPPALLHTFKWKMYGICSPSPSVGVKLMYTCALSTCPLFFLPSRVNPQPLPVGISPEFDRAI